MTSNAGSEKIQDLFQKENSKINSLKSEEIRAKSENRSEAY